MVKGIQITENGGVEVMKYIDVELPLLKEFEVLVSNKAIGVNFIDTYHRTGLYPVEFPCILGREGAGIIQCVGSKVEGFKVGDRVVYLAACSYAEQTIVSETMVSLLPPGISFSLGAACLLQGLTGLTMLEESCKAKAGDFVLVHAVAGGMGLILTQLCKSYGAVVIGTTSSESKAEIARKHGADHVINYTKENVVERVMEITSNKGVQIVLDGVGKDTFDMSLESCAYLATFISYGNASGKVPPFDIAKLMPKTVKLMRTSLFSFFSEPGAFDRYTSKLLNLVSEEKLQISIHKSYPLQDVAQAHNDLEGRKTTGKLLLIP